MPIHKDELIGKYIKYYDRDGKTRVNKVMRVSGNKLTVKDAVKQRRRIHLDNVLCQIHHGHCVDEIIYRQQRER